MNQSSSNNSNQSNNNTMSNQTNLPNIFVFTIPTNLNPTNPATLPELPNLDNIVVIDNSESEQTEQTEQSEQTNLDNIVIISDSEQEEQEEPEQQEEQEEQEESEQQIGQVEQIGQNSFVINMNPNQLNTLFSQSANAELIDGKIAEIMTWAYNNTIIDQELITFIDLCYLKNLQYDDEPIDTIKYTIRTIFETGRDYDLKKLVGGIFGYSMMGINYLFNENFDVLNDMLNSELKRVLIREIQIQAFMNMINGIGGFGPMEDVKLVLSKDELDKIPTKLFKELDNELREKNPKCLVCQDEFGDNDNARILNCSHLFHTDCIDNWLMDHSHKCPCCRKEAGIHNAKI